MNATTKWHPLPVTQEGATVGIHPAVADPKYAAEIANSSRSLSTSQTTGTRALPVGPHRRVNSARLGTFGSSSDSVDRPEKPNPGERPAMMGRRRLCCPVRAWKSAMVLGLYLRRVAFGWSERDD